MGQEFRAAGDVFKVDEGLGLVFGWAIVCKEAGTDYFDVQGDHIPEDAMLKAAADFMADHRVAKEMHAGDQVGKYVFAWPMTAEIAKAMGIQTEKTGLMVAAKFSPGVLAKFNSEGGSQVTEVKDGKDKLEGYEIVLETADKKEVEVTVAPDGKILEDSTDEKKKEEKK